MDAGYLVRYGRSSWLGFCAKPTEVSLDRGDPVIIRTTRGLEHGEILTMLSPSNSMPRLQFVRVATQSDLQKIQDHILRSRQWLEAAQQCAERLQLPLLFADVDVSLDGNSAWFLVVHWQAFEVMPLIGEMQKLVPIPFELLDISRPLPNPSGCSSCGCTSRGCGNCGTENSKPCGTLCRGCSAFPPTESSREHLALVSFDSTNSPSSRIPIL